MKYTCAEYRAEMILLGLRNRLKDENLNEAERNRILEQIEAAEEEMELE